MATIDPALQQEILNDPDVQAMLAAYRLPGAEILSSPEWRRAFALQVRVNQKYKGRLPSHVGIQADGSLKQEGFFQRNFDKMWAAASIPTAAGLIKGAMDDPMGDVGPVPPGGGTTTPDIPPSLDPNGGGGILNTLKKWAPLAGDLGDVLSTGAEGQAKGRREDFVNNSRAIAENNRAKVEAARYNLDLPSVRTNQTARGEVLSTMQNAPMTGDPRIDKFSGGGLRPSAFGPQSRQAGAEMSRYALERLMNPESDRLVPQEIPESKASLGENILGGAGLGFNIFSLLAKYGRNPNGTNQNGRNPNGLPPYFPQG